LLVSHGRTVGGEDVVPGGVPRCRFAGDVHSVEGLLFYCDDWFFLSWFYETSTIH
jgi:hypothetical protein